MPLVLRDIGVRRAFGLVVAIVLSTATRPALAISKEQCLDANARAQDLRLGRKLSLARDQLRLCVDAACPSIVRSDCAKWLDEVERALPTIAFQAKDASGADVTAVGVTVDGEVLVDRLDGRAMPVDPGPHVFTFTAAGGRTVTRTLIVTEGEKWRREQIVFGEGSAPGSAPAAPTSPTTTTPADGGGGMGTYKILGLAAGGVGVAGLAVGTVFGLLAFSEKSQQESACGSSASCAGSAYSTAAGDRSAGLTDSTIATVGFIAGGALLVGGAILFLTAPSSAPRATGMTLVPSLGPGGGGLVLGRSF
jgi:hypothetical protein